MKKSNEQSYLETSILTASPEDLIVKIFDVLIIACQQAQEKLLHNRDDIEGIHKALLRAQRACTVLMSSLNMEIGGELSANLLKVYGFWHRELVMANLRKDRESRTYPRLCARVSRDLGHGGRAVQGATTRAEEAGGGRRRFVDVCGRWLTSSRTCVRA